MSNEDDKEDLLEAVMRNAPKRKPKIPDGYVLVKISELPGWIRESLRAVMKEKPIVFARSTTNYQTGGFEWSPLYNGQEPSNDILQEMGNNAAQAVASHEEDWISDIDAVVEMSGGTSLRKQTQRLVDSLTDKERELLARMHSHSGVTDIKRTTITCSRCGGAMPWVGSDLAGGYACPRCDSGVDEHTIEDRILRAVFETLDTSEAWARARRDPNAFRRAVRHVLDDCCSICGESLSAHLCRKGT